MHTLPKIWRFGLMIFTMAWIGSAQEDSLQSALNAVNRRQRDLSPDYRNFYTEGGLGRYYTLDDKDDLAFLKPENERLGADVLDYVKNNEFNDRNRFSSSFRERIDKNGEDGKELFAENFLNRLGPGNDQENNDDFLNVIHSLYQKYYGRYPDFYETSNRQDARKRGDYAEYYPRLTSLGYGSVGLRKKNKYYSRDEPNDYRLNYEPSEELINGIPEDKLDDVLNYYKWNLNPYLKNNKVSKVPSAYALEKRFPLAKRSNPPSQERKDKTPRVLASTDPKVAKELSSIFSDGKSGSQNKGHKHDNANILQKETLKKDLNESVTNRSDDKKDADKKELVTTPGNGESLQIKKKSIDWSDYFGYDRKKKFSNDVGNEWLMERYHKAIAMATKRNFEKPHSNLNHNEPAEGNKPDKKNFPNDEETKLVEMDLKLKNIEDSIIDEALKYTGAHESATDSKEIQDIKDRVISRLAAAYSLEKMRQALGEYKMSIAKQRKQLQESGKLDNGSFYEEKRASVPRKAAIKEREAELGNEIKCTHQGGNCGPGPHRSSELFDEQDTYLSIDRGECRPIEESCVEFSYYLSNYGRQLIPSCLLHLVCLYCTQDETHWYEPISRCNELFLTKAYDACEGNQECQKVSNRSISYLLDVHGLLQREYRNNCNLSCPDNRR